MKSSAMPRVRPVCCLAICFLGFLFSATSLLARNYYAPPHFYQAAITGKVTDRINGAGIAGVNITLQGTTQGTVTDANGNFGINGTGAADTLVFSSVGYATQIIAVGNRSVINIALEASAQDLNQIVVVGYGTQEKKDVTGAVGSIESKKIAERPTINVLEGLAGRVAGLNIHNASGRPGGRVRVNIRGLSSINASTEPLYVIDGMIGADINLIDPNDIESIDVLKDASATAIYGSRGANGVILVTTKGAKKGVTRTEYRGIVGVSTLSRKVDVLNATEFMEMRKRLYADIIMLNPAEQANLVDYGADYPQYFNADGSPKFNTDWQDEATRPAISHRHYLSFSGGGEKFSGGVSLGLQDEQGIILTTFQKKMTARIFGDIKPKEWLTIGASVNYGGVNQNRLDEIGVGATSVGRHMVELPPFLPVRNTDGTYTKMNDVVRKNGAWDIYHGINVVALLEQEMNYRYLDHQFLGNLYADIKFSKSLSVRTTYARKLKLSNFRTYRTRDYDQFENLNAANLGNTTFDNWQVENFITYNKAFGEHEVTAVGGASWLKDEALGFNAFASNFADEYYSYYNLSLGRNPPGVGSNYTASKLNSYYARVNYAFMDKYLLTATGRYDGSSRFGPDNQYAFFPSAAIGWRISEENFLKGSRLITDLKLRVSYGVSGNSSIGDYNHLGQPFNQTVIFNDARTIGISQGTVPNSNLRWEKVNETNIGFDLSLLDRISLSANFYNRKTSDLLFNKPIAVLTGYSSVLSNIGSVQNRGVEVTLNTQNIRRNTFNWSSGFVFAANKNKILALGQNNEDVFLYTTGWGKTQVMRVGEEIGAFWGYTRVGIWGTAEAAEAALYNRIPGDIKLLDVNGDKRYSDDEDAGIIGSPFPDFDLTVNNTFTYKNWSLAVDIRMIQGAEIADASMFLIGDRNQYGNTYTKFYRQAWTPQNQNTMQPRVRANSEAFGAFDSRHIFDGSFIRGQNLALTYRLPQGLIDRWNMGGISVFLNLQNFFLIDTYHGFDPEVSAYGGQFSQGIDLYSYPKSKIANLGINLSL